MKKLTSLLLFIASFQLKAQQTVQQILSLHGNGVNSTEILMYKEDNINFHSIFSNSYSFGIYNSSTGQTNFMISPNGYIGLGSTSPQGKLDVAGNLLLRSDLNNQSLRPAISTNKIGGEIRAYSTSGYLADDGLLRISAGGGSTASIISYIDISAYSTVPDLNQNIVFGTGGTEQMRINSTGNVGIGTALPKEKLSVNGKIRAQEIKVEATNWPDYVFEESYPIGNIEELESYIKIHKHLPEVPSAREMEAKGVELGKMNIILLKKIEEMTLYLIELKKQNIEMQKDIQQLKANAKNELR